MNDETLRLKGLHCPDEIRDIENVLEHRDGILELHPNLIAETLGVRWDSSRISREEIVDALASVNLIVLEYAEEKSHGGRRIDVVLTSMSGVFVGIALCLQLIAGTPEPSHLGLALYMAGVLFGATQFLRKGLSSLLQFRLDMNNLMTVAVIGAMILGEWFEAGAIAFLFALSELLEGLSVDRARRAIRKAMDIAPPTAWLLEDGEAREVPAQSLHPGQLVLVKPGERIPSDGEVVEGASHVDESPITGESVPVAKGMGDSVYAGTLNTEGSLTFKATAHASETVLARILKLVEESQARKAPVQRFVDQFAAWYTPLVFLFALGVLLIPPLAAGADWHEWGENALVVLMVACPCALVISTPVAIVSGLTAAARRGIVMKGGVFLERLGAIDAVAFDKTGTLTRGGLQVTDIVSLNGSSEEEILGVASGLESRSEHYIAKAILAAGKEREITPVQSEDFQAFPGRGVRGTIEGTEHFVGNHRWVHEREICSPELEAKLESLERQGKTAVFVGNVAEPMGLIGVSDTTRDRTRHAVDALRRGGVRHLAMLTGDNELTAKAVAGELHLDEVRAELLPEDKVEVLGELKRRFGSIAMVGDGINDAPALAAADVGIAMGGAGTQAALETADVVLMNDDLTRLPDAFQISRRTRKVINANIGFALSLKAVFMVLALQSMASIWMAIGADVGASMIVIANSLRLLRNP